MQQLKCSFCNSVLRAISPVGKDPSFRCFDCNIRIIVSNPSYLNSELLSYYWYLVKNQLLTKQTWGDNMLIKDDKLKELRASWEGEREVIVTKQDNYRQIFLVVVKEDNTYSCMRYFPISNEDKWGVSVDGANCDAETVMRWLCEPSASTCRHRT